MSFNNYNNSEPSTYTLLWKKLEISPKEFEEILLQKDIDSHTQISQANLYAKRF